MPGMFITQQTHQIAPIPILNIIDGEVHEAHLRAAIEPVARKRIPVFRLREVSSGHVFCEDIRSAIGGGLKGVFGRIVMLRLHLLGRWGFRCHPRLYWW